MFAPGPLNSLGSPAGTKSWVRVYIIYAKTDNGLSDFLAVLLRDFYCSIHAISLFPIPKSAKYFLMKAMQLMYLNFVCENPLKLRM